MALSLYKELWGTKSTIFAMERNKVLIKANLSCAARKLVLQINRHSSRTRFPWACISFRTAGSKIPCWMYIDWEPVVFLLIAFHMIWVAPEIGCRQ